MVDSTLWLAISLSSSGRCFENGVAARRGGASVMFQVRNIDPRFAMAATETISVGGSLLATYEDSFQLLGPVPNVPAEELLAEAAAAAAGLFVVVVASSNPPMLDNNCCNHF